MPSQKGFYIPSLDGVRAIAYLMVFVAHAGFQHLIPGGLGVTIFFFLSGYLITTLLRREFDGTGVISLKNFYIRRVLRIFPPFYFVLFTGIALMLVGFIPSTGFVNPGAIAAQALHMTNYWQIFHDDPAWVRGTDVFWSLAVEEHFYIAFPLLYIVMRRLRMSGYQQAIACWALCALVLLWRCVLVFHYHASIEHIEYGTDTRFDSMLFGCALAVYGNPVLDPKPTGRLSRLKWFWLPLGLAVLVASLAIRQPEIRQTLRYTVQGIALYPLFITVILDANGWFKWLNWGWMRWLGRLSYSLYLTHGTILIAIAYWFPKMTGMSKIPQALEITLGFFISLLVSWAIHQWIERPAAHLKKFFSPSTAA